MFLPENAKLCIARLEQAGFPCYAVGGCVRDAQLGLTPHDYDLCTSAKPAQIEELFCEYPQVRAGEKHGTVGIVFPDGEIYEITTFRTESTYSDSRHPDRVEFVDEIEKDLARRDFTINAMAYSPTRGFVDPFGGRADMENGILRTVGAAEERFTEDALRIVRGVRFSVRFGLRVEEKTLQAMFSLTPELDLLARERVFDELCKLIVCVNADDLCLFAPILSRMIPELAPCIGFEQHNPHHIYDVYGHTAHVVAAVPPILSVRLAALLHDIGKPACFTTDENGVGHFYGHAEKSAELANVALRRLKAPNALRTEVVRLIENHMAQIPPSKKAVRRWLSRMGAEAFAQLLTLQEADMGGTGTAAQTPAFAQLRALSEEIQAETACLHIRDLAVDGHDLMAQGYHGGQIGKALQTLLDAVLDERVENERQALLAFLSDASAGNADDIGC